MQGALNVGSQYVVDDPAVDLLGRGAVGAVYRGRRVSDGGLVAVKVLDAARAHDPEVVTRFVRERDVLVRLRHPNLVPVLDLVVEGSVLAVVMDLVPGGDLRQRLDSRGALPVAEVCRDVAGLLRGLAVAHAAGVVHRDIKPENVLLDGDLLRLADFGIARIAHGTSLTRMTSLVGTPDYMAPELAEQSSATPQSDLYAVGVLLYECLAGVRPFRAAHPVAVLRKHLDEEPPRLYDVPAALWQVVSQLLAKDPAARPASALAVAEALDAVAAQQAVAPIAAAGSAPVPSTRTETVVGSRPLPPVAVPAAVPSRSRRRRLALLAAPVVLALGVAGALLATGGSGDAARASSPVSVRFDPEIVGDGVTLTRTWTLSDDRVLAAGLAIQNTTRRPVAGDVDEAVPKSVAASARDVATSPKPQVVQDDPVLRWAYRLGPGQSLQVSYSATLPAKVAGKHAPGAAAALLSRLVDDQHAAQRAYAQAVAKAQASRVRRLVVAPTAIRLMVGQQQFLAVSGVLANGQAASPALLGATTFLSSDPRVVAPGVGYVVGIAPGRARIAARLGNVQASALVTVVAATAPSAPALSAPSGGGLLAVSQLPASAPTAPRPAPVKPASSPAARPATSPSPKPSPRPSPKPSPKPSPTASYAKVAAGATYEVKPRVSSGTWSSFTSNNGAARWTHLKPSGCPSAPAASVTWSRALPNAAGKWRLEVYLPGQYGAANALYHVRTRSGSTTVTVHQNAYGSYWLSLGTWQFGTAPTVTLNNADLQTGDCSQQALTMNADSVRWVYVG